MDLRQIRYFLTVAEELNITKASERLHLSQPPLSRALMDLEEELGCRLMIRGKRQITLTPEGLALKKRGEQMFSLVDKTKTEISELGKGISGTLYLGHVDSNGPSLVSEWIQSFQKECPNVTYNLWCGNVDDLTDRLESGILDLAVIMTPLNSELLDGIPVFKEGWVAMIPSSHRLARVKKKSVDIAELASNDLIISSRKSRYEEISSWFSAKGEKPRIKIQVAHSSTSVHLVERGMGIAIFPASVAKNISSGSDVVIKKITPEVRVTYLLAWDKKRTPGVLPQKFIEHVKGLIKKGKAGF